MNRLRGSGRRQFMQRALALAATPLGPAFASAASRANEAPVVPRMRTGAPSITAQRAAHYRAVHQVLDHPRVLDDPFAVRIIGRDALASLQQIVDQQSRSMRASIVMRSRYAEDRLAAAVERGVRQYVVLGAGLDTFAYRNIHAHLGLRVFEVDHPATQAWKRARLKEAGIGAPASAAYVAVDFETQSLDERLRLAGFAADQPAFFSMLGVAVYISRQALFETVQIVRACAAGSEVVFDFGMPATALSERAQASRVRSMANMRELGEPWQSFYEPVELADALGTRGFEVELLSTQDANQRYFSERADRMRIAGSTHMLAGRT